MALLTPFHLLQPYSPTRSTHAGWSVEALSIKPTPTLLWGRTTCYAVGLCTYLCQCQARALTIIDYVCLLYQPKQGIDAFRSPETITLCLSNEWVVPAGQNKAFFNVLVLIVTFLFFAVLFTGLTYMYAAMIFGAQMESKRFRKTSGNLQGTRRGLWVPSACSEIVPQIYPT